MIESLLLHLTARSAPPLRRLGLVGDAVALWSRATRRRRLWTPHEARCHAIVRTAIARLDRRRTVAVLGSGLLRDVPVAELAAAFERVILVDAVHLLPARIAARRLGAEVRVADLTGLAAGLTGLADAGEHPTPQRPHAEVAATGGPRSTHDGGASFEAPLRGAPQDEEVGSGTHRANESPLHALHADPTLDLVISANVLSQLPFAVERWLDRHPVQGSLDIPGRATDRHLADLAAFRCPVCLLTDVAHRRIGREGAILEETDLLRGRTLPRPDETWDWTVAPPGERDRDAHVHRVHGYVDLGHAA